MLHPLGVIAPPFPSGSLTGSDAIQHGAEAEFVSVLAEIVQLHPIEPKGQTPPDAHPSTADPIDQPTTESPPTDAPPALGETLLPAIAVIPTAATPDAPSPKGMASLPEAPGPHPKGPSADVATAPWPKDSATSAPHKGATPAPPVPQLRADGGTAPPPTRTDATTPNPVPDTVPLRSRDQSVTPALPATVIPGASADTVRQTHMKQETEIARTGTIPISGALKPAGRSDSISPAENLAGQGLNPSPTAGVRHGDPSLPTPDIGQGARPVPGPPTPVDRSALTMSATPSASLVQVSAPDDQPPGNVPLRDAVHSAPPLVPPPVPSPVLTQPHSFPQPLAMTTPAMYVRPENVSNIAGSVPEPHAIPSAEPDQGPALPIARPPVDPSAAQWSGASPPKAPAATPADPALPGAILFDAPDGLGLSATHPTAIATPSSQPQAQPPQAPQLPPALVPDILQASQLGEGPITLHLRPEELGTLHFHLSRTAEGTHIHLTVDQPATFDLLRRHADELLADLQRGGFAGTSLSFAGSGAGGDRQQDRPSDLVQKTPPVAAFAQTFSPPTVSGGLDLRL